MFSSNRLAAAAALALIAAAPAAAQDKASILPQKGVALAAKPFGFGRPVTKDEIKGWDIDVRPDGHGLPPGKGSVKDGEALYQDRCAACHGEFGEGKDRWPTLIGGTGKLTTDDPKKGVGNYWPYATTLFDYIRRAMPFGAAQTLTDDEVYAITAYVLNMNDIVKADAVLDREALLKIKLPNAGGFVPDPRPDFHGTLCMKDCKASVEIHSEARKIGVTPEDEKKGGPKRPRVE
ncbi:MAG: cytochrome c [Rhodospirillaceae bacterium]|nr:cytochrome c [Rhodospirillaceae bacterium]